MKTKQLTAQALLDSDTWSQYVTKEVVKNIPVTPKVEIEFFNVGKYVTEQELETQYFIRGLKPVDPYNLILFNKENPDFCKDKPNGIHWQDNGWCYAAFRRWNDGRGVDVHRGGSDWSGHWWFGGVRLSAQPLDPLPKDTQTLDFETRLAKLEEWAKNIGYEN